MQHTQGAWRDRFHGLRPRKEARTLTVHTDENVDVSRATETQRVIADRAAGRRASPGVDPGLHLSLAYRTCKSASQVGFVEVVINETQEALGAGEHADAHASCV